MIGSFWQLLLTVGGSLPCYLLFKINAVQQTVQSVTHYLIDNFEDQFTYSYKMGFK